MNVGRASSFCCVFVIAAVFLPAFNRPLAAQEKPRILMLTHSQGFKHSSLETAEKVMTALGRDSGLFEVVALEGYKQNRDRIDLSMITADTLGSFAAVMFFTTGELPLDESQKKALLDFVRDGGAYIGTHSATDTFYSWPAYARNLSGAYFKGHGPSNRDLILKVEDKNHPATKMLGDSWTIADEFYQFAMEPEENKPARFSRDRVRVLLSVDTDRSDLAPQRMQKGEDYPIAWCREVGEGKAFYTALGHREEVWNDDVFQRHLLGGIKWALGLEAGDATPSASR